MSTLRVPVVVALTATATERTAACVARALAIAPANIQRAAPLRPNLALTVARPQCRDAALLALLRPGGRLGGPPGSPGPPPSCLVYTAYRGQAERCAALLFANGVSAVAYHAGRSAAERGRCASQFLAGTVRVCVATTAFGMGLDKADVRAVVNYSLPRSVEAFVQQAGRGGRDGGPCECATFLDDSEYLRLRSLTFGDGTDAATLAQLLGKLFPPGCGGGGCGCVEPGDAQALGLRPEAVDTLLAILSLPHPGPGEAEPLLALLPEVRPGLALRFHNQGPTELARQGCALCAAVLRLGPARGGTHALRVPQLAEAMGASFDGVADRLAQLAAQGEISYTLADTAPAFTRLRAPGDADALARALAARLAAAEACQVGKLDTVYAAAAAALQVPDPGGQEGALRTAVAAYFAAPEGAECAQPPALVKRTSAYLKADIRALLRTSRDALATARNAALVLHGLASPRVSADTWRKHPSWGRHTAMDFACVLRACREEMGEEERGHGTAVVAAAAAEDGAASA